MAVLKTHVVGDKEVLAKLRALGPAASKVAARVLYQKAEVIAGKAKDEHVPVDWGALKSTIHATLPEEKDGMMSVSIVAGGPAKTATRDGKMYVGYAEVVHEDLTARHPVGGPKYIERPWLEVIPSIKPAMLKAIDKVAKGK